MPRRIAEPHRFASHSARRLAPEDQAENEADAERGEDGFGRIFPHVLLAIFLQGAGALLRIAPGLLGLAAILARDLRRRRAEIFRRLRARASCCSRVVPCRLSSAAGCLPPP